MSNDDLHAEDHASHPSNYSIANQAKWQGRYESTNGKKKVLDMGERRLMICGSLCLSVLGIIAFLITGQVAVVVAMNSPLLAIIGKDYFLR